MHKSFNSNITNRKLTFKIYALFLFLTCERLGFSEYFVGMGEGTSRMDQPPSRFPPPKFLLSKEYVNVFM